MKMFEQTGEELCVVWKRASWGKRQYRIFQREKDAYGHMEKLLGDNPGELSPLTELYLQRRVVGAWLTCTLPTPRMRDAYAKNVRPAEYDHGKVTG